ncbi:hypothetical protein NARC_110070 [Candidatus Nitrosocosmicus arcticus]|uniref:Uncharacterized protein n=1 Tax=Candidatus Nitrosocosmicus arcticus TaxID=2035267 RepID=A0A557STE6_9ARCH|nr:hypothetical protein NARC_110070 [Candidatus Nitrosocosmicus arcticus]
MKIVAQMEFKSPAMKNRKPSKNKDTPAIISEFSISIKLKIVFYYKNY